MPVDGFLALRKTIPLVDVRSPAEFAKGHIPGAFNLPLFNDEERAAVGTLYVQEGRDVAVLRGLEFAGPRMADMVRQAMVVAGKGRDIALTCWRGGMRSASVAWLLTQAGFTTHCLPGGYKAYRRYVLEQFSRSWALRVLGGMTGSGKTELLHAMRRQGAQVIDLEGLAKHRGSAFGAWPDDPQPSTEHFENLLAEDLCRFDSRHPIWVEDESCNLGTVNIAHAFLRQMQAAPLIVVEVSREERLNRALRDYDPAHNSFASEGVRRIRKRLGGAAHDAAQKALVDGEYALAASLLLDYYDRAYMRQLDCKPAPAHTVVAAMGESLENVAARIRACE